MADDKLRRSLALPRGRASDLRTIKQAQDMKTDTAAIDEAISFRARFASRKVEEVQQALWLYDEVRSEIKPGCRHRLVLENPAQPGERLVFALPALAS